MQSFSTDFEIPAPLRQYCDGKAKLVIDSTSNPQSILDRIAAEYPKLYRSICDESGKLRKHLNLFVNEDLISGSQLGEIELRPGDVVGVFQAVSGG
ncbi:MoaD/ThiS family protein [Rhodopirellula sp. MGV]|uniref:MoaD/ThiS family protein n=1 Tax=Rhodopirellula sp. MGV TaxID=2023130 RepID=UPI0013044703|nr:MoaD/ThiS family protein [Rhodopirellula sp. MGV]